MAFYLGRTRYVEARIILSVHNLHINNFVFRFYLLKNVSSNIRTIVMYRRKFIHDMYNHLVLLAYCGLCQFGPASYHDKEKSFFYLNRRATLWDTTSSTPGYQKIEDKDYPKLSFYFDKIEDVLKYWSTMNNICKYFLYVYFAWHNRFFIICRYSYQPKYQARGGRQNNYSSAQYRKAKLKQSSNYQNAKWGSRVSSLIIIFIICYIFYKILKCF